MDTRAALVAQARTDPALAAFFLGRLAGLALRLEAAATPGERAALARAVFSDFLDCDDLGLGEEARAVVAPLRREPAPASQPAA